MLPTARSLGLDLRAHLAGLLLLVLPLPLLWRGLWSLMTGDVVMLGAATLGYALFVLAAFLTRRGVQGEIAARDLPVRHRRVFPWKRLAGGVAGLATGFSALAIAGHEPLAALASAIGTVVGYFMLYGGDPRPAPLPAWGSAAAEADARKVLEVAYQRLEALDAARRQIAHREFKERLGNISLAVGKILRTIEDDPADLRRARKFLKVYLDGAQKVALQYARTQAHDPSAEREQAFRSLLVDVENTCREQHEKLLQHDALDLDVQIEVLTTRLRREGVA